MVHRLFSGEYDMSDDSMTAIAINKKEDSLRRNKVLRQCHFRSTINGSLELGL